MDIYRTARKHGVSDGDVRHAVEHALYAADVEGEPPLRVLYLGPDRSGNLLEVVVIERDDGSAGDPRDEDATSIPQAVGRGAG